MGATQFAVVSINFPGFMPQDRKSFRSGRRGFHLFEGGNLVLQLSSNGFYFFRLFQLDLLKVLHRRLLLRLGSPVLRVGDLLLRGLNLFLHLGAGCGKLIHSRRAQNFDSGSQRGVFDIGYQPDNFIGNFG